MSIRQQLIADIGASDQQFLIENRPELALKRAKYRLELIHYSNRIPEKIYFLQEAIVILEQARLLFEEIPLDLYLDLSIALAEAYLCYFKIEQKNHFATIIQQVLKPLSHHPRAELYFLLAYASAIKNEPALTQYWLKKYFQHPLSDLNDIITNPIFTQYQDQTWWTTLTRHKYI